MIFQSQPSPSPTPTPTLEDLYSGPCFLGGKTKRLFSDGNLDILLTVFLFVVCIPRFSTCSHVELHMGTRTFRAIFFSKVILSLGLGRRTGGWGEDSIYP